MAGNKIISMIKISCLMLIIFSLSGCKCRLAQDPGSMSYNSIKISKENNAFIAEYTPQNPYLTFGIRKYQISEAWLEHTHLERNFKDVFTKDSCLVITITPGSTGGLNLRSYVKEMGSGPSKIWFNLDNDRRSQDTIVLFYRDDIGVKKKMKEFLFFKKK